MRRPRAPVHSHSGGAHTRPVETRPEWTPDTASGKGRKARAASIRQLGQPVVAGFSTHSDWDHVLWHAELGEAPRYGTARCADFMQDVLRLPCR
ncbi:hypothetical protein B5181_19360 [Streptomyces sp. 4F]|nr:hypothetical protein B5181_19360 [Streptomyces sp. 4F]